jgi:cob(I)alamin adenosyltransferase
MSVEKEIRKILGEATPAATRAKQDLVRSGLGGRDKNASAVMKALENPEAAMKNPAKREMLLKVMQDLLDVVVNDQSMMSKTKTALRKEEIEELDEKLHPNQKKLDKNKNGKLDAEDFKKLRGEAKKPKAEDDE